MTEHQSSDRQQVIGVSANAKEPQAARALLQFAAAVGMTGSDVHREARVG
jgi:hypothetical protein